MSKVNNIAGIVVAALVTAPTMLVLPTNGWAQSIEEITVTTRRKTESLQDVPLAITVIGAEEIERQGINSLKDIANLDPSVGFDTSYGPADTRVAIRGLSNTRGRSNVAFLIDGIDVTTENVIAAGSGLLANQRLLSDVERIEIVKGPQSALFGRAAFAGAISYTTKEPSDVLEGNVRADVGEYGNQQYSGFVSTPMGDTQGIRFDGVVWSADGYYQNETTGMDIGGGEGYGLSGTYVWEPSDVFKAKIRSSYSDDHYDVTPNYPVQQTRFAPIPAQVYTPIADGGAGLGIPLFGSAGTRLSMWRPYCPDVIPLPATGALGQTDTAIYNNVGSPGICLPESMGSYGNNEIRFDTSPSNNGVDNAGTDQELLRLTLNLYWDLPYGTVTYAGGWTSADSSTSLDQDYQFDTINHQQGDYATETNQLSNEIRFASAWEGPVQLTTGFLQWDERRRTKDQNFIIGCVRSGLTSGDPNVQGSITLNAAGGCDGASPNPLATNFTELRQGTVFDWGIPEFWRTVYNQYAPGIGPGSQETAEIAPTYWKAKTDHKSIYAAVDWDISEKWKATIEDRYVEETFQLKKPNQSSCTLLAIGTGQQFGGAWIEGQSLDNYYGGDFEQRCSWEESGRGAVGGGVNPNAQLRDPNSWAYIEGTVTSKYHTPKVTVNFYPNDEALVYGSVGWAQKPAGINQLSGGGSAETIESASFLPEKMIAYEFGAKTTWEAAGTLQANSAVFFQDYTDKQISTQVLDASGQLRPVISNAGGAEVWGFELETTWLPEFVDGLTLQAAYTLLNAKYTNWNIQTKSEYNIARTGQCRVVPDPSDPAARTCAIDLVGNQLERSPENAFVGQFNYTRGFGTTGMEWFVEGNTSFQDERYLDPENTVSFDAYWLTDLRLGLIADRWDALVYVDNVFADDTIKTGGSGPDFAVQVRELGFLAGFGVGHYFATAPDPRVVGVRASYRFGGN
jgi:iron complex outermembrane receptor protein